MQTTFKGKRVSSILGILPEKIGLFNDEVDNYTFPAKQTMRLKKIMGFNAHRLSKETTTVSDFAVFGLNNFAARFPSALMVAAAMALLYFWGKRLYGSRVALVAALLFATSLETWYVGHAIITDMTLLVTVSLTLIMFYRGYTEKRNSFFYYSM